jgi:1-acyl-sn-glycerol-3-phosphate acyltransferase
MLYGIRRLLLGVWRGWFYLLAALPVLYLFPFLVVALLLPNGYRAVFWMARNIWAPWVLLGMGFWPVVKHHPLADTRQAYLLIANHASYIDPFLMLRAWKKPFVFVGKKELVAIPLFGYLYKRAAIMVDRSSSKSRFGVYGRASQQLNQGYSVCIFPERNYLDESILLNPFKRGAFKLAIEHQLPVLPMAFYDCKRKMPWYTYYGHPGTLRVQSFAPISTQGLNEDDLPQLQEQAYQTLYHALTQDPNKAIQQALDLWERHGT